MKTDLLNMKLEQEIVQHAFKNSKHKALINIIYTYNWIYEKEANVLKPYDISSQQYNILRILRGQYPNPATIKLIKGRMLDKMSDVSRLVDRLKVKGLLERKECKNDRRNVDVIISQDGLKLLSEVEDKIDNIHELLGVLSDSEINILNDCLDRLRNSDE
jgi:DNA-binding MarR family transcriptional regulator